MKKAEIEEIDKAKDLKTINLGKLQSNKVFFDTVKKEGYDLIKFVDYTIAGIDYSFVPLVDLKPIKTFDVKLLETPKPKTKPEVPKVEVEEQIDEVDVTSDTDIGRRTVSQVAG